MAASTGPVLAMGAITLFNDVIVHGKSVEEDIRVIVGTGIAAGGLALFEKLAPQAAVALAWLGLVTVLLVRVDPKVPSPVEAFQNWYSEGPGKAAKRSVRV